MTLHSDTLQAITNELEYADSKHGERRPLHDQWLETEGLGGQWERDLLSYWGRAKVYMEGGEAGLAQDMLIKAACVVIAAAEANERVNLTMPGYS